MHTLIAYAEDIDLGGAEANLAVATGETHVTNAGDDVTVPRLNQVVLAAGHISDDAGEQPYALLTSPSLIRMGREFITPIMNNGDADLVGKALALYSDRRDNPRAIVTGEELQARALGDTTAAAFQAIGVWLSDGPVMVRKGASTYSMRFTTTGTVVARTWTSLTLTPADRLNAGRYQVVGMRAESATVAFARLIDNESGRRPGVIGSLASESEGFEVFRNGQMGVFMEFEHNQIPRIEVLCDLADTFGAVYLDLIKIRD